MSKEGKTKDGHLKHFAVGIIIEKGDKILMIERTSFPFGWACPTGHMENGETPAETAFRETEEEIGCEVHNLKLFMELPDLKNPCKKGVQYHHWFGFTGEIKDDPKPSAKEVKNWKWVKRKDLKDLELEPIWEWWCKKVGWIK